MRLYNRNFVKVQNVSEIIDKEQNFLFIT